MFRSYLIFTAAIQIIIFNVGCLNTASIKIPLSAYPDIAKCVTDPNSQGQCSGETEDRSSKPSVVSIGDSASYFEALSKIKIPVKKFNKDKLESLRNDFDSKDYSPKIKEYFEFFYRSYEDTRGSYKDTRSSQENDKEMAKAAQTTFLSETNRSIRDLFVRQLSNNTSRNAKSSTNTPSKVKKVEFDATDAAIFAGDLVNANNYGGLTDLEDEVINEALNRIEKSAENGGRLNEETDKYLGRYEEIKEDISYTKKYIKAYFRQWKIINISIEADKLKDRLVNRILGEIPFLGEAQIIEYVDELFFKMTGNTYTETCPKEKYEEKECLIPVVVTGTPETSQFVSRAGDQYGFPYVNVALDPLADQKFNVTTINWKEVGADIVRVYIEAIGDRLMGLPADPASTLCEWKTEFCYPLNDKDISTQYFFAVSELASQTEAQVSTAVGQLTRGVWWTSLNNEALAYIIETAAGAVAKKGAEKFGYCVYSCVSRDEKGNDSVKSDDILRNMMSETTLKKIKVKVTY